MINPVTPVVQDLDQLVDIPVVMLVNHIHKVVHPVTHLEEDIPVEMLVKITHKVKVIP